MAAVEAERSDGCQFRDGTRELDDPCPIFGIQLSSRPEHLPTIFRGLLDEFQHPHPCLALSVLSLRMESNFSGVLSETAGLEAVVERSDRRGVQISDIEWGQRESLEIGLHDGSSSPPRMPRDKAGERWPTIEKIFVQM